MTQGFGRAEKRRQMLEALWVKVQPDCGNHQLGAYLSMIHARGYCVDLHLQHIGELGCFWRGC